MRLRPIGFRGAFLLSSLAALLAAAPASGAASGAAATKYVMLLGENWEISGGLPLSAMLISLQGVANVGEPRLYFRYPPKWDYTFCDSLLAYYRSSRGMQFAELLTPAQALDSLGRFAKGYVVWE